MVTPVRARDIDTGAVDGKIDKEEWNDWTKGKAPNTSIEITADDGSVLYQGKISDFDATGAFISQSGAVLDLYAQEKKVLDKSMTTLLTQLNEAKKNSQDAEVNKLQEQLKQKIEQAEALAKKSSANQINLTSYKAAVGADAKSGSSGFGFKASTESPGGGAQPQTAQQPGGPAAAQVPGPTFRLPTNWGAHAATTPLFNSQAYMSALSTDNSISASWDAITTNQNRGKQLMMLFFYFAKMAESGDMGAMYQFMKFITYIISKDKAKQQIEMGKKLIQLQDLSRQWTNKLVNMSTDSNNPNASNELAKTMTIVKSETDAIATSQKLISQMMEEFSQVVETLTNVTKSALEAHSRIMRTVSTVR